ncbi:MAG: hypothetical protein ACAI38_19470 [Myxococcota bacterium]
MLWVDLALQAFRDVRVQAAVTLQRGYNAVVCDSVVPETVIDAILELCLPSGNAEQGRGIITFVGRDGATYRVLRDFATAGAQLYAFEPTRRQFVPVADGAPAVAAALSTQLAIASRELLADTFTITADHMPAAETPRPPNPAARARLAAIEAKIASQARGKQLETQLDAMTQRRLEVDDAVNAKAVSADRMKRANAALAPYAQLTVLPDDFLAMYESAMEKERHKRADLVRWQQEHDDHERLVRAAEETPVLRDWRVIAGVLSGAAAVGVGLWLGGSLRYIAFLDIPAFGLATFALWQNLSHREALAVARKRLAASDRRREQIESRDAELIAKAHELAAMVGFSSLDEVRETIKARDAAKAEAAEARRLFHEAEEDPELMRLREEKIALESAVQAIEKELATMGMSGSDIGVLQAEAAGLRRLLGIREERADELSRTFEVALRHFGGDATQTAMALTQRSSQFIQHLSGKKLTRIEVDIDGTMSVVGADGVQPPQLLPVPWRELVILAVRGALLTALPPERRLPVLVGPFELSTPGGDELLRRYLGVLAQAGLQVLHLLDRPQRAEGAPNVTRFVART